ncbi:hypothetical protein CPB83DRAFT_850098 [Crepidotus variabilis]|uniref:Transmembrane protein n=1 Tax=Crepidotus variabilis TaxID=179855 RepID=A0A9P6EJ72_9AGAR|nr:hypothetical protein CPB83DRAFT_850098 [Crepidotus variabilis]
MVEVVKTPRRDSSFFCCSFLFFFSAFYLAPSASTTYRSITISTHRNYPPTGIPPTTSTYSDILSSSRFRFFSSHVVLTMLSFFLLLFFRFSLSTSSIHLSLYFISTHLHSSLFVSRSQDLNISSYTGSQE